MKELLLEISFAYSSGKAGTKYADFILDLISHSPVIVFPINFR